MAKKTKKIGIWLPEPQIRLPDAYFRCGHNVGVGQNGQVHHGETVVKIKAEQLMDKSIALTIDLNAFLNGRKPFDDMEGRVGCSKGCYASSMVSGCWVLARDEVRTNNTVNKLK